MRADAQDMPAGGVAAKTTATFPSLASALAHPWRRLRARWTHKLVYVLRGAACSMSSNQSCMLAMHAWRV